MRKQRRYYGWVKQPEDTRDIPFGVAEPISNLPAVIDLQPVMPALPVQGQANSCTGNGIAFAGKANLMKLGLSIFNLSRLFIYYNERLAEGTTGEDNGANIRDGIKSLNQYGVCDEKLWPYDLSKLTVKPTDDCYKAAILNQTILYKYAGNDIGNIRQILAAGYPIVYGFSVFDSFETTAVDNTGIVPLPKAGERLLGGHCVVLAADDSNKGQVKFANWYGPKWGAKGYGFMSHDYIENPDLVSDLWVIEIMK